MIKAIHIYEDCKIIGGFVGEIPDDFNLHLSFSRWVSIPGGWFDVDPVKKISAHIREIKD
jgi:hypothetical protein